VFEEPLSTRDLAEDRTTARATPEGSGRLFAFRRPAYSNNITIDGLDNNDDRGARERFTPSIEAVAECRSSATSLRRVWSGFGGRVNLLTRSGANSYHGRVFYFFRDESLNANIWKNNSLGLLRLPLQEHDPGFTFSGPLIIPSCTTAATAHSFSGAYEV